MAARSSCWFFSNKKKISQIVLLLRRWSYWTCTTNVLPSRLPMSPLKPPIKGKSGLMLPLGSSSATAIYTQQLVDCCCKAAAAVWVQWRSWLQQEQHSTVMSCWAAWCHPSLLDHVCQGDAASPSALSLQPCKLQLLSETLVLELKHLPAGAGRSAAPPCCCFLL